MQNKLNSKRIDGVALELIMRDVLDGMFEFTSQACSGSETARMDIVSVEQAGNTTTLEQQAIIVSFPAGRITGKK